MRAGNSTLVSHKENLRDQCTAGMAPEVPALANTLVRVPVVNSARISADPLIQRHSETPYNSDRASNLSSAMTNQRPAKGYFTEAEAAKALGLSLAQFRVLVHQHILDSEGDMANLSITSFQPSDLAVLRILVAAPLENAAVAI